MSEELTQVDAGAEGPVEGAQVPAGSDATTAEGTPAPDLQAQIEAAVKAREEELRTEY